MTDRRSQSEFKAQLALLAHVYKVEIIEMCSMVGAWMVGVAEDFYALAMSLVRYSMSHHRRPR